MSSTKEIKRRIKSIENTGKITRAMEMVSAAKMKKAVDSVLRVREYAHTAYGILVNLSRAFETYKHDLLDVRPVKKVLIIAITSNRGLCGSFNSQVFKKIKGELDNPEKLKINRKGDKRIITENGVLNVDFITIGKKGGQVLNRLNKNIVASFDNLSYLPKVDDVAGVTSMVVDDYRSKKYDKVDVVYTDYVSPIVQKTKVRQVLPVSKTDLQKQISDMDGLVREEGFKRPTYEYKVEPNPTDVLDEILPKLIEMQIYHAILESNASKEAMRMMAMRNATDASKEMAQDLTFVYNQIRQMKITQEIAEISAGRAALE